MKRLVPLVLLLAGSAAAYAQSAELDRVERSIAAGDYDAARDELNRWWSTAGSDAAAEADRPRALLLRARLAPDAAAAEQDFLALVLGYPSSPYAAEALLRLGQALLAAGDAARAAAYLDRLALDHPRSPLRATGVLWLARARLAAGSLQAACAALNDALALDGTPPQTLALLRHEQAESCRTLAQPAEPLAERPAEPTAEAVPAAGRFAVQTGAFRQYPGAQDVASRLRRAGFDPRIVFVPASGLARVRVGRFASPAGAEALARRIRRAGFPTVVVDDAARERDRR